MKYLAAIALVFGLAAATNVNFDGRQKICNVCVNLTNAIHDAVADPNFRRSLDIVLDVQCLAHRNIKQCTEEVDDFVSELQNNLTAHYSNPVGLCTDAHLCKAQVSLFAQDDRCDQCVKEITEFESKVFSQEFNTNLTNAIEERFCNRLPRVLANLCKDQVEGAVDRAINYLKQRLGNPQEACQRANLCPEQLMNLNEIVLLADKPNCMERCHSVNEAVEKYVLNPRLRKAIVTVSTLPCRFVTDRRACEKDAIKKVNDFYANLTANLEQNGDKVCNDVCRQHQMNSFAANPLQCFGCQVVEKALYNAIQEGKTEAQIEADIEQFCNKLPAQFSAKCQQMVEGKLDRLYKAAQDSNGDAKAACVTLGDCTASGFMNLIKDENKCQMCRDTLQKYQSNIQQNAADLTSSLKELCQRFGRFSDQCEQQVANEVPYIAHYLTGLLNPNQVCPALHFC